MKPCPRESEWPRLLEGELKESEAHSLRAHLEACASCRAQHHEVLALFRRLAAPVPGARSEDESVAAVMRRVRGAAPVQGGDSEEASVAAVMRQVRGAAPVARAKPHRLGRAGFALAALAAAGILVAVVLPRVPQDEGTFTARGGGEGKTLLERRVGVDFLRVFPRVEPLRGGEALAPDAAYRVSYRNLDTEGPVHLLAFAIDAAGEVHWLYPAHPSAASDEAAVRLVPVREDTVLPESVVLEGAPPGPLRLVTVVTREPLRVSAIEALPTEARTRAALQARWPQAVVRELQVKVR